MGQHKKSYHTQVQAHNYQFQTTTHKPKTKTKSHHLQTGRKTANINQTKTRLNTFFKTNKHKANAETQVKERKIFLSKQVSLQQKVVYFGCFQKNFVRIPGSKHITGSGWGNESLPLCQCIPKPRSYYSVCLQQHALYLGWHQPWWGILGT